MRSYGQHCPVARAAEVLATRWTLLLVRDLLLGCRTLRELEQGAPGIPRALLRERMEQLELAGVVTRRPKPHGRGWVWELTDAGRALGPVCEAFAVWGAEWLELRPEHLDPWPVLWGLCRRVTPGDVPGGRFVVRFEVAGAPVPRLWLLLLGEEAEVCRRPPGFPEDAVVRTDPRTLVDWHVGAISLGQAVHAGRMVVEGGPEAERTLAAWGGLGAVRRPRAVEAAALAR